ncbi:MAG TPA: peptide chain release factor 2 [Anaerolineales bacterium]|nr:peptide chain release factor 2 [Anaerolineales bacterium]
MQDLNEKFTDSHRKAQRLLERLDIPNQEKRLAELESLASSPEFWNNPGNARAAMREMADTRETVTTWQTLMRRLADALELSALDDDSLRPELESELESVNAEIDRLDFESIFTDKHDHGDAILSIHSGAGGVDAQDWAQMLLRMYTRWAEARGYTVEELDHTDGEEAGIKSVTLTVAGRQAFGYLKAEKGVHRLVRLSPFDSAHRRHTSFAQVEIMPQLEENDDEVVINPTEIEIDTYKSSGAGGQNVQKNETAIRITHLPTGIVVTCQNERSQTQNRENALKVLRAKLYDLKMEERAKEIAALKGQYVKAEFGSQIRSYVLHPYQMVKDHRTNHETANTGAVLDGRLDDFMEAYLRATVSAGSDLSRESGRSE